MTWSFEKHEQFLLNHKSVDDVIQLPFTEKSQVIWSGKTYKITKSSSQLRCYKRNIPTVNVPLYHSKDERAKQLLSTLWNNNKPKDMQLHLQDLKRRPPNLKSSHSLWLPILLHLPLYLPLVPDKAREINLKVLCEYNLPIRIAYIQSHAVKNKRFSKDL
jgi:hypothetical protein